MKRRADVRHQQESDVAEDAEASASVLLFLHIPKAAGTALVRVLDSLFDPAERLHLYGRRNDSLDALDLPSLPLSRRRHLRFVAGHFLYGIHEWLPAPCQYITVLRDPVERIRSLYDHFLNYPEPGEGDWHNWIVKEGADLHRFVAEQPTAQTDNYMVRLLAGKSPPIGACSREMLDLAKYHLDDFALVMFQDALRPGLAQLSALLDRDVPVLPRLNVASLRTHGVPQQTREMIKERNSLDVELYAYAQAKRGTAGAKGG
ncbi:MAG TPA: hypothetical protein VMO26_19655 [Vicinamibacterales bacterium]|nr:hypothetical protein [Vicinamibacterales bacterium]